MASISGLQNNPTNNLNTIDGLQIINASAIYDNGVLVDTTNLVPYTGATQTINAGAQAVKSSYYASANDDLINFKVLTDAVLYNNTLNSSLYLARYNTGNPNQTVSDNVYFLKGLTVGSTLNVSGITTLQGALNVSGITTLQGATTINSSLNVSGITTLQGATTINSSLCVSGTTTLNGMTTATPSFTLGINGSNQIIKYANPIGAFSGNVDTSYLPFASSTNVFANSLLSQSGTTLTNSGNEYINGDITSGVGKATDFGEIIYSGINNITTSALTTTGLTAAAPAVGTLTYSAPTYTLTFTTQYMGCMWSNTTYQSSIRTFFTFTNFNYAYYPSATITVCQANSANTAYTALTSAIPLVVGTFKNFFLPNTNSSYTGQIFFIFTGAKFGYVSWDTFTIGYGAFTVQGNQTNVGTIEFPANGNLLGGPTATATPSVGTRITFWGGGAGSSPYSMGMEGYGLWFSSNRDFKWYNGGTTPTLKMTLNNGNLGLGTSAPDNTLTVVGAIQMTDPSTSQKYAMYSDASKWQLNPRTSTGGYNSIQGLSMNSSGQVGINTVSPTAPLDIQGIINMGAWNGLYDSIVFNRGPTANTYPNINCQDNTIFMYASGAGGWLTDTAVGDIGIRVNSGRSIRFGANGGSGSGMVINSTGVGVNVGLYLGYLPQTDWVYGTRTLCMDSTGRVAVSSCVGYTVSQQNSINWGGGANYTNAFYRHNAYVNASIRIRYSTYAGSVGNQVPYVRLYSQSTGSMWYYAATSFSNVVYQHTTFYYEINFNSSIASTTGWFDVYVYNNGNCITDTNDQLMIWVSTNVGSNF